MPAKLSGAGHNEIDLSDLIEHPSPESRAVALVTIWAYLKIEIPLLWIKERKKLRIVRKISTSRLARCSI